MEYFGTNLREAGHYRWLLTEKGMEKNWSKFDDLPFHPEYLNNIRIKVMFLFSKEADILY